MTTHTFVLNGETVTVEAADDERLLWVLRDLLGVTGPKYGCGLGACRACTSHVNGRPVALCSVPVGAVGPTDHVTTIEGLAGTVGADLHPVQQAWIDHDVAQCGFCQPGQIMAAVGLIDAANADGRLIDDSDLDGIQNICRCGTYPRIRQAIVAAQQAMLAAGTPPAANAVAAAASTAQSDHGSPTPRERSDLDDSVVEASNGSAERAELPRTGASTPIGVATAAAATAVAVRVAASRAGDAES